jgi:tetratricopeptide (TPR) repeat protein
MNNKKVCIKNQYLLLFFLLFSFVMLSKVSAQTKFGKTKSELAKLKKLGMVVEANPENIEAHQAFIGAVYTNDFRLIKQHDSLLIKQYAQWMKKFPKSAAVPFALGRTFAYRESPQATEYLLKAVKLNPNLAEAWKFLSEDATLRSDLTAASEYMKKAVRLEPENADYASSYAFTFKYTDSVKFYALVHDVIKRFPDTQAAALTLLSLALDPADRNEK